MFSPSTKKHFKIFRLFFSILLCLLLILSGLFLSPKPVQAWTNTDGGDHGGADWTPANGTYIAGNHTNIGTFTVAGGTTVYIQPYNGSSYGWVQINANTINIQGTLTATGQGYGGGGAGGGGAGRGGREYTSPGGTGGSGTAGGSNGQNGTGDPYTGGTQYNAGLPGGAGGSGGGSYGGSAGAGGAGTPEGRGYNGNPGSAGKKGGYSTSQGQGDSTTDESLRMGSGGGGAGGGGGSSLDASANCGGGGGGGGAGNRGGGWIKLYATNAITISGAVYAKGKDNSAGNGATGGNGVPYVGGSGGNGGGAASSGGSNGGAGGSSQGGVLHGGSGGEGGYGAGGGILIKCSNNFEGAIDIDGTIDNRGGGNDTGNGGTIKIFHPEGSDLTFTHYQGRYYTSQFANTKPKAATGQGASVVSYNQVDLSWTDESGIEDGYRVYRQVEGSGYSLLDTIAAGSTSYSDNTTTYNKSYQYYVVAYNGTAESDEAYTTTVYTPCANADVQENQSKPTQKWYQEGDFIFSSSNLDNDYIEYYRYKWDRNPATQVTGSDSQWMTGTPTLTRPPYNSKKNYLHVLGYNLNNESASQGTQHYGPYYFVETYRLLRGGKFFDDDGVLIEMGPKE